MKFAITAAAGLALAAGANADVTVMNAGPVSVGSLQTMNLYTGNLSGSLTSFNYSFLYGEPIGDVSWASDMIITVTGANGNSFTIGGYQAPGDFTPTYNGPGSDAPGVYSGSFNVAAFNVGGSGIWTIDVTNDWPGDLNPNTISNFTANLIGSVVPTPGALGLFGVAGLAAARRRR